MFPPPLDLVPEFLDPSQVNTTLGFISSPRLWKFNLPDQGDLHAALARTAAFTTFVNAHLDDFGFWRQDSLAFSMLSVLHAVLSLERVDPGKDDEQALVLRESIRLALVVFFGLFIDLAAIPGCRGFEAYPGRVKNLIMDHHIDWTPFLNDRLWVLVVCGAAQLQKSSETTWYVEEIVSTMLQLNLISWVSVMDVIRGLCWIELLALHQVRILGEEVDEIFALATLSHH